jgi:hypothetical protein
MNIVRKMLSGRFTLKQLGLTLRDIRKLKDEGHRVQSQKMGSEIYYYITTGQEMSSLFISGESPQPVEVKWVELSDLHFGSIQHDSEGLKRVLQRAVDEGFKDVHVSGDVVDGLHVYRGHMTNLRYWKAADQANYAAEVLSQFPLKYIAIKGNHCYSFEMDGSPPIGTLISQAMDNYTYLNSFAADLIICGVVKRMIHGMTGRTYAKSYPGQTYIRDLLDSQGEHIYVQGHKYRLRFLQIGHFHSDISYESAGILVTHPGNFQFPNDYTIRRGLVGSQGCRFTTAVIKAGRVLEYSSKFVKPR